MAEDNFPEDEHEEERTAFSGQLGGLSTSWLNLLKGSERFPSPLPPLPGEGTHSHEPHEPHEPHGQMPVGEQAAESPNSGEPPAPSAPSASLDYLSSLFEERYGQVPPPKKPQPLPSDPAPPANSAIPVTPVSTVPPVPMNPTIADSPVLPTVPSTAPTAQPLSASPTSRDSPMQPGGPQDPTEAKEAKGATDSPDSPIHPPIPNVHQPVRSRDSTDSAGMPPKVSMSMYAQRPSDDYVNADLQRRRAEDERRTGRRWPGNGIAYPGSSHEAMFFDQLAIALGEVEPQVLARESALRYVRSSRIPGDDDLGPTDIHAICYYGLGLALRPLDCTGLPHILAVYNRFLHEIYIDWTFLPDAPFGLNTLDPIAWRRSIDASQTARVLLAWCAATHISDNYDVPLVLGFNAQFVPGQSLGRPGSTREAAPPPLNSDAFNRYRKTVIAFTSLLAPQERLWQQITAMHLRIRMGDPEWRAHMRAEYRFTGGWSRTELPVQRYGAGGGYNNPSGMDPAEQLITVLANQNNCPPLLIESQLDDTTGMLDWDRWSLQLLREVSTLKMRYTAAERYFASGTAVGGMAGGIAGGIAGGMRSLGRGPDLPPLFIRLSF